MPSNIINLFIAQIIIITVLFGIIVWFIRFNKFIFIEKRFKKFCLEPLNNDEVPFLDRILNSYINIKFKISKSLIKMKSMKDYSKKYEKYLNKSEDKNSTAIDYVSTKVIWGVFGIFLIILSCVLRYSGLSFYQIAFSFLIGFYAPDLYWYSKEKYRKKQIDKDMLKAIIIMNNAFKSGLSIMQAIYMVSNELDGPISDEFKKMYIDISFGLDMDLVFERFTKRINTEEAHYITTSLAVLNKTGGNIVQVFSSVERNAFTRKKLKEELDSLSASANAIYKILIAIPPILSLILFILNPKYFMPLISTTIGKFIFGLIIAIYVSYILIIRKVVRIKGV